MRKRARKLRFCRPVRRNSISRWNSTYQEESDMSARMLSTIHATGPERRKKWMTAESPAAIRVATGMANESTVRKVPER